MYVIIYLGCSQETYPSVLFFFNKEKIAIRIIQYVCCCSYSIQERLKKRF